ncbi:chromosome segregation protein SMC [Elusimicrobiota bacterium]
MFIKNITLKGFKSFVNETDLIFDPGITCVVGPNGSGKTNVLDAIRWCLGELSPRTLRSKSLTDVIFNGTKRLTPSNNAQVTITFDNSDGFLPVPHSEVAITRKVSRSGESDYMINKSSCRLKDIKQLLLGTGLGDDGYSIMEGSMIEFLLNAKPQDRRLLFDEASGASKYAVRRDEALSKLTRVELDLERINDQVDLVETEMKNLERQARRAKQHEKLVREKKNLEIKKIAYSWDNTSKKLNLLYEESIEPKKEMLNEQTTALSGITAQIEAHELTRVELEDARTEKSNALAETTKKRDLNLTDTRHLEERILEREKQIETAHGEVGNHNQNISNYQNELNSSTDDLREYNKQVESFTQGAQDRQIDPEEKSRLVSEINSLKETLADQAIRLTEVRNNSTTYENQMLNIDHQLKYSLKQHKNLNSEIIEITNLAKDLARTRDNCKTQIENASSQIGSLEQDLKTLEADINALEDLLFTQIPVKESELQTTAKYLAQVSGTGLTEKGRRTISDLLADFPQIRGPISGLINTSEPYRSYLDGVLGEKLNWFLAEDLETATRAIEYLKTNNKGRATFIILSQISENIRTTPPNVWNFETKDQSGNTVNLETLLGTTDITAKGVISFLIGPMFLRDTTLYLEGIIQGGESFLNEEEDNAQRCVATAEAAHAALAKLETEKAQHNAKLTEFKNKRQEVVEKVALLKRETSDTTIELARTNQDIENKENDIVQSGHTLAGMETECQGFLREISSTMESSVTVKEELRQLEGDYQAKQETLHAKEAAKDEVFEKQRINKESALLKEIDKEKILNKVAALTERVSSLNEFISSSNSQINNLNTRIKEAETDIASTGQSKDDTAKELDSIMKDYNTLCGELEIMQKTHDESRQKFLTLRGEQDAIQANRHTLEEEIHEHETQTRVLEFKVNQYKDEFNACFTDTPDETQRPSIEEIRDSIDPEATIETMESNLASICKRLEQIGQINFLAQEEFTRLENKTSFLKKQKEDITSAASNIKKTIETINAQIEEKFNETFEAVRIKFKETFNELFEGGESDLVLTNREMTVSQGVEIFAQPPGKTTKTLSLLSQGEKALTALALLFAFFSTRPSPICVLDEIDAPLDEANVTRFKRLIEKLNERCQFIVITHNKRTMETAHALYGVTMQELGVSKIISVKLQEAQKELTAA